MISSSRSTSRRIMRLAACAAAVLTLSHCEGNGSGLLGAVNTPSADATLSALALSSGTLTPAFAATTTSYAATVTNATSTVTVTPTTTKANAVVTVNGTTVTSGSASAPINLVVGTNTIAVIVTAEDGSTKGSYVISVVRAAT